MPISLAANRSLTLAYRTPRQLALQGRPLQYLQIASVALSVASLLAPMEKRIPGFRRALKFMIGNRLHARRRAGERVPDACAARLAENVRAGRAAATAARVKIANEYSHCLARRQALIA